MEQKNQDRSDFKISIKKKAKVCNTTAVQLPNLNGHHQTNKTPCILFLQHTSQYKCSEL
jgi:hypothetical protein